VKHCKSKNNSIEGYKIYPNDLVKVGRVRFKIKDIMSPVYKGLKKRLFKKTS